VKRLVALIPPKGAHLTCFHGVFAPSSKLRPFVVKEAPPSSGTSAATASVPRPTRVHTRPRLDWASLQRRTFAADVWTCPCGGRRRVLAVVTTRRTAEQVLQSLGVLPPPSPRQFAQSPPQRELAL